LYSGCTCFVSRPRPQLFQLRFPYFFQPTGGGYVEIGHGCLKEIRDEGEEKENIIIYS
jgi:hypothetical protein